MRKESKLDFYRMTGRDYHFSLKNIFIIRYYHQIRYMICWRKSNRKMTLYRKYKMHSYSRKYGLEISTKASIGGGLYLGHPYNITVGDDVKIGENVHRVKFLSVD